MRPTPRRVRRGHPVVRLGLLVRRDPRAWWLAVLCCAVIAGAVVSMVVSRAERARVAWGAAQQVLVATHDLAPGTRLEAADVRLAARPSAMVPSSALSELPGGATVGSAMLAGEVVVTERLTSRRLSTVAAMLPPGSRAIAIPTEPGSAPPLAPGDVVDVLVALPVDQAGDGPPGFVVAAGALVVSVDDNAVTVAVGRDTAPRIAVALGQGAVTLALGGA